MRIKDASKTFGGACFVYAVIAACSGGGHSAGYIDADGSAPGGHDGSTLGNGDGAGGDLIDALTNPIADAKAEPSTSGTRLKAKYYAGADGSRQFVGWHDSQRNEDCSFSPASDGATRCLPGGAPVYPYFSDAACTSPIAYTGKGCATPAYGLSYATSAYCYGGTGLTTRILLIAGSYTAANTFTNGGGTCISTPNGLSATYDLYTTGAEVPASSFVQAAVQIDP